MFTSIAILVGLAVVSFFMFLVLVVAGFMLLKGKKPVKPGKTEQPAPSWLQVESTPQVSYRQQINAEKADAVMQLYADMTQAKFIEDTRADAIKMFSTASPAE